MKTHLDILERRSMRPLRAMVLVELSRAAEVAPRSAVWSLVVVAVFALTGRASVRVAVSVPAFFACSLVAASVTNLLRDKFDGSMEFWRTLPQPPGMVVGARLVAGLVLLLLAAPLVTWALVLWAQTGEPQFELSELALGMFSIVVCVGAAVVALGQALVLRFRYEHVAVVMLAFILGAGAVDEVVPRVVPDLPDRIEAMASWPGLPLALAGSMVALAAGSVWLGYRLSVSGLIRYRLDRDRKTW